VDRVRRIRVWMSSTNEPERGASDATVIGESAKDSRAFAVVFDRHYDEIWRYLCRRIGSALADELASETFLRAFARRAAYDHAQMDARPWLYGIATNLLRDHARSEARRRRAYARAFEPEETSGGLEGADGRVDASVRWPATAAALARLEPGQRDAVLLLALTDLDYEGIAIALGVPVGTVRSRVHRARRRLRLELEPILTPRPAIAEESTDEY
jgi:RNA polymerase sigma factor (sigma-70 family)